MEKEQTKNQQKNQKKSQKLQWHPAFCSALRLELLEDAENLEFTDEFQLTEKPLQIDCTVVKVKKDCKIKNEIGKIFRKHNIFEYKSPMDELNIDTFYKAVAYACLYKVLPNHVNEIPAEEITITLIRDRKPVKLLGELEKSGYECKKETEGIYYVSGVMLPVQIIASSELDVDTFAKERAYMVRFEIPKGSPWHELRVMDAAVKYGNHFLVCILERGDDVVIPSGHTMMMEGDTISIIAPTEDMNLLFNVIGIPTRPIRNVMIAGGGTIAYYLAQRLLRSKVNTTIVESNLQRCNQLSERLDRATIIYGDAADSKLLLVEGLEQMDAFVALTNFDEENIMLSLYAHQVSKAKLITKINKIAFEGIVKSIPVGSIISPKYLTAEHIIQYVRDLGNSMIDERDSKVDKVYRIADG